MDIVKRKCNFCGKSLVKIGCDRINRPSSHSDWSSRTLHKKCWLMMKGLENLKHFNQQVDNLYKIK